MMARFQTGAETCVGATPGDIIPPQITRKRYIELTTVAYELCGWLKKHVIKQAEVCELKEITGKLWLMKEK